MNEKKEVVTNKVNPMCENCLKYNKDCCGTSNMVWTGCVYKKIIKK